MYTCVLIVIAQSIVTVGKCCIFESRFGDVINVAHQYGVLYVFHEGDLTYTANVVINLLDVKAEETISSYITLACFQWLIIVSAHMTNVTQGGNWGPIRFLRTGPITRDLSF